MNLASQQLFGHNAFLLTAVRFYASKMQASSTQNGRDSKGRRLGYNWFLCRLKVFGGGEVAPNDIIARQRGFNWKSGNNVIVGKDQTIHAACEGVVKFRDGLYRRYPYSIIDVEPAANPNRKFKHPAPYNYHPELFPERAALNHKPIKKVEGRNRVIVEWLKNENITSIIRKAPTGCSSSWCFPAAT